MKATLREARREDIPSLMRIRSAVLENRLTSRTLSFDDYVEALEYSGRGWVVELGNEIIAVGVGNAETGNIWALFVLPGHEHQGHGRLLHDAVVSWLWSRGPERLWLTTEGGTRAQHFYERAGWTCRGPDAGGELCFELRKA